MLAMQFPDDPVRQIAQLFQMVISYVSKEKSLVIRYISYRRDSVN